MNGMNYQAHREVIERTRLVREALANCNLCPHQCGVDRTTGEEGYCGLDDTVRCFRDMLFYGEESELIPSHQIHLAGCNLRCEFCVVAEWNQQPFMAEEMDFVDMVKRISYRQSKGAKTLNFLGGEPTINLHGILELLGRLEPGIRVVMNSNMYYNEIVDKLMTGLVDVYLADFKCGNNNCAKALLGVSDYMEVIKQNILKATRHADIIIRHVVMPGHSECCLKPIFVWLAVEIPGVKLSIRDNYVPPVQAASAPMEYLTQKDMQNAVDWAEKMRLRLIK